MYERFTDRARKVLALANQEAQRLNHEHVGTEHILLGLVKEGSGTAADILKHFGVKLRLVRVEVDKRVTRGQEGAGTRTRLQTALAKKVIECAIQQARTMNHTYVGTEHLLLGLLHESAGIASDVLRSFHIDLLSVQVEVAKLSRSNLETAYAPRAYPRPSFRFNQVLDEAIDIARKLNHAEVDPEHLLVAGLGQRDGVVAQVFSEFGVRLDEFGEELMKRLLAKRG